MAGRGTRRSSSASLSSLGRFLTSLSPPSSSAGSSSSSPLARREAEFAACTATLSLRVGITAFLVGSHIMALAWARASLFCSSSLRSTIWSSAKAFLSAGSHFTASLRSAAAFDQMRILANARPRRAVAFPWSGSKRSASVQSMAASRHSSSFSNARARFARHAVLTCKASVSWPTPSTAASFPSPWPGGSYFSRRSSADVYVATASRKRPSAK
mmetsp:Transcript_31147/g.92485  ORF Transcript_31147/g.92485 Transcript_31147/m.92485 type:complete len:214 (+) Transcript_31147:902-1543(+)